MNNQKIKINDLIQVYTEYGVLIEEILWRVTYIDTRYKKTFYEAQSLDGERDIKQMELHEFKIA